IKKGAVVPWAKSNPPSPYYMQVLSSLARAYDFDLDTSWANLPEEARRVILFGTDGRAVTLRFIDGKRSYEVKKPFEGVIGNLNRRMLQTESAWMREELSRYQSSQPCEVCHGARLRPEPLAVKIAGEDISMSTRRSVADAYEWFANLLDELSIGLHQKDNDRLLETLKRLKSLGNTVLVVEHDEDAIRHADQVIDMGPGAGVHGGEVIYSGSLEGLLDCKKSITADYLSGRREIPLKPTRRKGSGKKVT